MGRILNDYDRYRLYVVTVFAIPLGCIFLFDSVKRDQTQGMVLLSGAIVRELPKQGVWSFRPVVEISVDNKPFTVKAQLAMDSIDSMPRQVSFFYDGDPNNEVHLREETNPLWGASLCLLLPSVLFLWDRLASQQN